VNDPVDYLVAKIDAGHVAASWWAEDGGGQMRYSTTVDAEALIAVNHGNEGSITALVDMLDRASRGKVPTGIGAPQSSHLHALLALGKSLERSPSPSGPSSW